MAPSESPEPRSSLLLQSSRKWGINHLKAVKVTQELNVPAAKLIDDAYLPTDKDEGNLLHPDISRVLREVLTFTLVFRQLTDEITQPTEADLDGFVHRLHFSRHPYRPLFIEISQASWPDNAECSKRILWNFLERLTYPVEMKRTRITWTYGRRSVKFVIQPGGIKCRIRCEGIIHPEDSTRMLPMATLVVSFDSSSAMTRI